MSQTGSGDPLIDALRDPARHEGEVGEVGLVETHISWVLLAGEYAYKIKKPLELPFLDFSTLGQRKHFCEEELRLNRRLAPELYLDVIAIGGSREEPELGTEPAIDYAVRMRRFAADATLDQRLESGPLPAPQVRALAELIARFHMDLDAEVTSSDDEAERIMAAALDNFGALQQHADGGARERLQQLRRWTEDEGRALADTFRRRRADGTVREGHGDLHLQNLVVIDDRILPFDALEFDRSLRVVDVMNEAAFVVMDLIAHGRSDHAFTFLNRYLEVGGDYPGLKVLRFYLVYRALVRAKVRTIKVSQEHTLHTAGHGPRPYLRLALSLLEPDVPLLAITHGLSGSGKTTATEELIARVPALRLRSDLERKRLHGVGPDGRTGSAVGAGLYDEAASERTYRKLAEYAGLGLAAGLNVIVDAAFLNRERRGQFRELARAQAARFVILDFSAPEQALRERIARRARQHTDASEAGLEVLDHQLGHAQPLEAAERAAAIPIDTTAEIDHSTLAARLLDTAVRPD